MKKFAVVMGLLITATGASHLLSAKPAAIISKTVAGLTYDQGLADGNAYADDLAAQYGYPSQDYTDALNAEIDRAYYNATHSEEPIYWRGYRNALTRRR